MFLLEEGGSEYGVRDFFKDSAMVKIFLTTVFSSSGYGIYYIIIPFYVFDVIDKSDYYFLGIYFGIAFVVSTLLILPSGIIADRFSRIFLIRIGSITSSIGGFILLLASGRQELLVASLLIATSYPLVVPGLSAIIADRTPVGYGKDLAYSIVYGSNLGFFAVGNVLLYVFQVFIGFDSEGLRFTILVFALFNLFAGIFAFSIRHKRPPNRNNVEDSLTGDVLKEDLFPRSIDNNSDDASGGIFRFLHRNMAWRVVLINLMLGFGAGFIVPFFPVFFEDRFGLKPGTIGLIFAAQQVFMALGNFCAPLFSRAIRRVPTMALTESAAIICALYLAFSYNLALAIIAFIARGALMNVANPLMQSLMMDLVGENYRATATSTLGLTFSAGNAPSTIMSGRIIDERNSYVPSFLMMCSIYSLVVMVVSSLNRTDKEVIEKNLTVKTVTSPEMM